MQVGQLPSSATSLGSVPACQVLQVETAPDVQMGFTVLYQELVAVSVGAT